MTGDIDNLEVVIDGTCSTFSPSSASPESYVQKKLDGGYLTVGPTYWVRVSAINSAGVGPTTLAVPIEHGVGNSLAPRAPPGPPESVVVRSVGSSRTSLDVRWEYPSSDFGESVDKCVLEYDSASSDFANSTIYSGCVDALVASEPDYIEYSSTSLNLIVGQRYHRRIVLYFYCNTGNKYGLLRNNICRKWSWVLC